MGGGGACAMAPADPGTPPDPAHLLQVGLIPGLEAESGMGRSERPR